MYNWLPLSHCINEKVLVMHGGLFSKVRTWNFFLSFFFLWEMKRFFTQILLYEKFIAQRFFFDSRVWNLFSLYKRLWISGWIQIYWMPILVPPSTKYIFFCVKLEIYVLFHIKCTFMWNSKKMFWHYTTLKSSVL